MVYIHGGGWVSGTKDDPQNSEFAINRYAAEGCVVISADYRLATKEKNQFPDGVIDAACAIAWAQRNATKYGGDPNKILIGGQSAGAHITALIAYNDERNWLAGTEYKDDKLKIAGFIGSGGAYDWESVQPHWEVNQFLGAKFGTGKWEESEPVNFVSAGDPPGLIITGGNDSFVNIPNPKTGRPTTNSDLMAEALTKAGVYHELVVMPGLGHKDVIQSFTDNKDLIKSVSDFIKRVTGGQNSPST